MASESEVSLEHLESIGNTLGVLRQKIQGLSRGVDEHDVEERPEKEESDLSVYELRKRALSYLQWLSSLQGRCEGIEKLAFQIFESKEKEESHAEIIHILHDIQELVNEEFRSFTVRSVDASEPLSKSLLNLFIPQNNLHPGFPGVVENAWKIWASSSILKQSPVPSLYILVNEISDYLVHLHTLQDHYSDQEKLVGEDIHIDNNHIEMSYNYAVTMVQEAILIDQIVIQIMGSSAAHRSSTIGQLFRLLIAPLEIFVDQRFTNESFQQQRNIIETRTQFPSFLAELHRLYERIWVLLNALFHPGNRNKIQYRGNEKMTVLEFLYGSGFKNLILHRPVTKNPRMFPGIENKTIMKSIQILWSKSDSHLLQTLKTFALHATDKLNVASLKIYFGLLRHLCEFYGNPSGFFYPMYYHYLNRSRRKPEKIYAVMKYHKAIQYVADLFQNKVMPSVAPTSEIWKSYSSTIWDIDQEETIFLHFVDLMNQFSLVLIGSSGSLVDILSSYLIDCLSYGVNNNSFRAVTRKLADHIKDDKSLVDVSDYNMLRRLSVDLYKCVNTHGKTVAQKLVEFCENALQRIPTNSKPKKSKQAMMDLM